MKLRENPFKKDTPEWEAYTQGRADVFEDVLVLGLSASKTVRMFLKRSRHR